MWACQRCGATSFEWGANVSKVSSSNMSSGLTQERVPRLHGPPPPHPNLATITKMNLSERLIKLREWAPELFDGVFTEIDISSNMLCAASASLEQVAEERHPRDTKNQVIDLLLVGARLNSSWPGVTQPWNQIISAVTGAQPTSLSAIHVSVDL